jgi:GntR family transcriptional regulator
MKFQIEKDSPVPVHTQIKERIKIALTFGELRPGDVLPSIRDLEAKIGVGRAVIRRAYLDLQEQGLLEISHGRRVSISESVAPPSMNGNLQDNLDRLVKDVLQQLRKMDLNEISFARYLLSRVLDQDRAKYGLLYVDKSMSMASRSAGQIARAWQVPVSAASMEELPELLKSNRGCIRHLLTSYYRFDQLQVLVNEACGRTSTKVVPVRFVFSQEMTERISSLTKGSTVLLLNDAEDFRRNGQAFADAYHEAFRKTGVRFVVKPATSNSTVKEATQSEDSALVVVSNVVWDRLPENLRKSAKLTRPTFDFDGASLEEARYKVGILQ